jgi:hypothetical protein
MDGSLEEVAVAEVNYQGSADTLIAELDGRTVVVLLARQDGSMDAVLAFLGEDADGTVSLLRVDGTDQLAMYDGIMTGDGAERLATELEQNGYGVLEMSGSWRVVTGDVNGDGWTDLVLVDSSDEREMAGLLTSAGHDGVCATHRPAEHWVCVGGGWVPSDHPLAQAIPHTAPTPIPSPLPDAGGSGCSSAAPGPGWVCVGGGWVPADHPLAQTNPSTVPAPLPSPPPDTGGSVCSGAPPGPGWVCIGGGWVPSDYQPPAESAPAPEPARAPEPAPSTAGISSPTTALPPRQVAFVASSDHATNVTEYVLKVFAPTANPAMATPLATSRLGKPAPSTGGEIRVDRATFFASLAPGTYLAVVTAVGPGGETSSGSVAFTR